MIARLAGYASVFDVADKGRDVVRRGAFAGAGGGVPLLWQHEPGEPIGIVEQAREDARGLRVIAALADTRRGRETLALLRAGALTGLSFGYRVKRSRPLGPARGRPAGRELLAVELIEVSLVTFPMQPLARVLGVSREAARDGPAEP